MHETWCLAMAAALPKCVLRLALIDGASARDFLVAPACVAFNASLWQFKNGILSMRTHSKRYSEHLLCL